MYLLNSFLFIVFSWVLVSCTTVQTKKSPQMIGQIEGVPLGAATSDIFNFFGQADKEFSVENVDGQDITLWIYFGSHEGQPYQKTTFVFDTNTKKLIAKSFAVGESDPESNFEAVQAKYGNAKLQRVELPWCNPHAGPHGELYIDQALGMSVSLSTKQRIVSSITWEVPSSRMVASAKECSKPIPVFD